MDASDFYNFLYDDALVFYESTNFKVDRKPQLFILTKDDEFDAQDIDMNPMVKEMNYFMQRALVEDADVKCVAVVSEAWCVTAASQDEYNEMKRRDGTLRGSLEFHPRRREAITFNLMTKDRQAVMMCEIHRDTKTLDKMDFEWAKPGTMSGVAVR
jgi:hypothetical protein